MSINYEDLIVANSFLAIRLADSERRREQLERGENYYEAFLKEKAHRDQLEKIIAMKDETIAILRAQLDKNFDAGGR